MAELMAANKLKTHSRLYNEKFPFFRQPQEIGFFSLDEARVQQDDRSQLKDYFPPKNSEHCKFDLRYGYDKMIKRDEQVKEYIDNLLHWIMNHKDKFIVNAANNEKDQAISSLSTDFVCWRGLLTRLLCVPYENRDDLLIGVIKFRNTFFLCEFETEAKKRQKEETTPRQEEMCAWGFKFEQYVTKEKKC